MSRIRLGVLGVSGRMGEEISRALSGDYRNRFELVAAPKRGDPIDPIFSSDVIIEFASPDAALAMIRKAVQDGKRVPIATGSTGWTRDQEKELEALAKACPILCASNFSLGIFLSKKVLESWAGWPGIENWKVSIREVHHTRKKDAPSGTALTLADAIRENRPGEVPIESVREGDVIGIHEVTLESPQEKITLTHEAKSRAVFATGALDAAEKLFEKNRANALPKRLLNLEDLYA